MNILVNGRDVVVQTGESLLAGLLANGFDVPNLCYLKELEPFGGCGLCLVEIKGMPRPVRACAVKPFEGMEVETESPRIVQSRKISLGLLLSDHRGDCVAPCRQACPANQDCQGYAGLIANGRYDEAFRLIMEDNPLPGCIGRVCPHPCEDACRRELLEGPLSLMQLKRFAADIAGARYVPVIQPSSGKSVAIIGAGPAGLSAAYFLARKGHTVEIFDMMPEAGGMLRYGIPSYRLANAVIDQEVARIQKMGVAMHFGQKLGKDIQLEELKVRFDAVFVAVGAWSSTSLGCEKDALPGVLGGIDFLRDVAMGNAPGIGGRIAVVGGGNTAMDVARTAIRLGAKEVCLIYRRTRAEMPADKQEIAEAEEEGVQFIFLAAPDGVMEANGRACGLRLQMMRLGTADASGRRRPEPTGEIKEMLFDTIIAAIGQKVLPDGLQALSKHRWQTIQADPATYATNMEGVFAGGDAINDGPSIAITAIAHGKQAAQAIDGYLRGDRVPMQKPFFVRQKDIAKEDLPDVPAVSRAMPSHQPPAIRKQHFDEFVNPFSEEDARQEASRCLECGCCDVYDCKLLPLLQQYGAQDVGITGRMRIPQSDTSHPAIWRDANKCVLCGLCVRVCGEIVGANALGFDGRGFEASAQPAFDWPLAKSECVSCGHCVSICPTGALQERRPFGKSPALPPEKEKAACPYCEKHCMFEIHRYGNHVLKAIPVRPDACCSIGRYAPVIENGNRHALTNTQAEALRKVLTGDLRVYQGELPTQIGGVILSGREKGED